MKFVPAVAYHFCLDLPAIFSQPHTKTFSQLCRQLKFKAWVKAQVKVEDKDAFRKAPDRATVKAWAKAWVEAIQNVY